MNQLGRAEKRLSLAKIKCGQQGGCPPFHTLRIINGFFNEPDHKGWQIANPPRYIELGYRFVA